MATIVKVSLDETKTPKAVHLELAANPTQPASPIQIELDSNGAAQSIHWHLSGNAYRGEFRPLLTGTKRGFKWIDSVAFPAPPPGIFDDPTLSTAKKALTLIDHHTRPGKKNGSKGEWAYTLRFEVDGVIYQTDATTTITQTNLTTGGYSILGQDPIIKNN